MSNAISRRNFLKASAAIPAVAGLQCGAGTESKTPGKQQEYYEIRVYKTENSDKQKMVDNYLEKALLPALGRISIDRIGIFTNMDDVNDYSIFVLIPYPTLNAFASVNPKLLADQIYMSAAKDYFAVPKDNPVFSRINSKFFKAFAGMPVIEMPKQTAGKNPRIFEMRIYESHTEEKAALKVDMFNSGEIQIMRDTELAPVFYGEALIGDNVPNLTYMLSASDREAHQAHWGQFGSHPEWKRMREMPKYKDTVSNITKIFLKPTAYSQI